MLHASQACYAYFMATRRDFTWEGALERHVGRWEAQKLAAAGFDVQHFAQLKREAARLGDLLAAQQRREAAAGLGGSSNSNTASSDSVES